MPTANIEIYPNPTSDFIHLSHSYERELRFDLFDLNGRLVLTKTIQGKEQKIRLRNLISGSYQYKLYKETKQIHTGKLNVIK